MKRLLLFFTVAFVIGFNYAAVAQDRTITGRVTSEEDGSALPGVSVIVKGTALGTSTDSEGMYTLSVPTDAVLVFSFIGFKTQETPVSQLSTVNVVLSLDATQLGEIVVTGVAVGTSTKKLGFAVGKVNEDQLQKVPAVDAGNALRGKTAGVTIVQPSGNPGTAPAIRLRGSTSLLGSQSPLIIVDGVITNGSIADFNMEDVQSIEVVRGAAASSLYGSLAGNGVIQIITKRGNGITKKASLTLRSEYGFSQVARDYPDADRHLYALDTNGDFVLDGSGALSDDAIDTDGLMDNPYPKGMFFDNEKALIGSQPWRSNSISLQGSPVQEFSYYLSYQNLHQEGVVAGLKPYDRNSIKWNMDVNPNDKVKISATLNYVNTQGVTVSEGGQGSQNVFFSILTVPRYINLAEKDENGDYKPLPTNSEYWGGNFSYNPLYSTHNIDVDMLRERFIGGTDVNVKITDWFTLQGGFSADISSTRSETYYPLGFLAREPTSLDNGTYSFTSSRTRTQITQASAIFHKDFGDFNAALTAKYLYEDRLYTSEYMYSADFVAKGVKTFQNGSQSNYDLSNTYQPEKAENYFINLDLDYKDKIMVSGLVRRDGSSLFGADARYKWYYRGSLAYRLTEDFTIPGVSELKLRASYGTSGQRPGWDNQYETYSVSTSGIVGRALGNRLLEPSVVSELELGINATFFSRINFEFNYAPARVKNDIMQVPLSPVTGFSYQYANAADLKTEAFEAMLSGVVLEKGNFVWDANLNFSRNTTIVSDLRVPAFTRSDGTTPVFRVEEGQPYGTIYGGKIVTSFDDLVTNENGIVINDAAFKAGSAPGATVDDYMINEDGYVVRKAFYNTANENVLFVSDANGVQKKTKIGNTNPKFIIGFSNTFSYKGFSLYALVDLQYGNDIYNYTKQLLYFNRRHQDQVEYARIGKSYKYSENSLGIYNGGDGSSHFVEDGSFVKIREISLSYDIKSSQLGDFLGKYIESARISLSGRNLFTFTNYSGWDPEVSLGNNPTNFRMDDYAYPNFRTYTAALQIKF